MAAISSGFMKLIDQKSFVWLWNEAGVPTVTALFPVVIDCIACEANDDLTHAGPILQVPG